MERYGIVTQEFLTLLAENRTTEAKRLIGYVEKELSTLPFNLKPVQQNVIKDINGIILRLEEGYDGSAITRAINTLVKFNEHGINRLIKNYVGAGTRRVYDQSSGRGDSYIELASKDRVWLGTVARRKRGIAMPNYEVPGFLQQLKRKTSIPRNQSKAGRPKTERHRSADLDTPSKIADQLAAIYNNEWREAFQALRSKSLIERSVVNILLEVIEEAYLFCQQESERQLKELHLAFQDILEFGTCVSTSREKPEDMSLLKQYRKGLVHNAVPMILGKFFETKLKPFCNEKLGVLPDKNGVLSKYANKVVELSWWMCVHDPPVYMCPTTKEGFDPKMYSVYYNPGTKPDFFARPALRVSESGPLLLQGIVQYR